MQTTPNLSSLWSQLFYWFSFFQTALRTTLEQLRSYFHLSSVSVQFVNNLSLTNHISSNISFYIDNFNSLISVYGQKKHLI